MESPSTRTAQGASSKACSLEKTSTIAVVSRETGTPKSQGQQDTHNTRSNGWDLFRLGELAITPAAGEILEKHGVFAFELLGRHVRADFGDLCDEDMAANSAAIAAGDRVLSSYVLGNDKVWVITEADRSVTTILLPSDY